MNTIEERAEQYAQKILFTEYHESTARGAYMQGAEDQEKLIAEDTNIYKLMDMEHPDIIKYINEPWWNDETIPCPYGTPVAYFIPLHRILIPD